MKELKLEDLPKKDLVMIIKSARVPVRQQMLAVMIYHNKVQHILAQEKQLNEEIKAIKKMRGWKKRDAAEQQLAVKIDRHLQLRESTSELFETHKLATLPGLRRTHEKDADRPHQNVAATGQA